MANLSGNMGNNVIGNNSTSTDISTTALPQANGSTITDQPADLDAKWTRWKCLNCGYTYEGNTSVLKCPKCGNVDPDKFGDE